MKTFTFSALGTEWSLLIDQAIFPTEHAQAIIEVLGSFERRFSRFLPESEVNQFREALPGMYPLSKEFRLLLTAADQLRSLTDGRYDPAIGGLLEHAGYDRQYRMEPDEKVAMFTLPRWSLSEEGLILDGPAVFDFGGIGKGYGIDLIADTLKHQGYEHFLVEGGGDMYGTSRSDGAPYRIALEWPGKPDTAFGVVELKHRGVAVSDSFKRRWKTWHHIIDPHAKKPVAGVVGTAAVAPTAFAADRMTPGLFLAQGECYPALAQALGASFVVFQETGTVLVSADWSGELF